MFTIRKIRRVEGGVRGAVFAAQEKRRGAQPHLHRDLRLAG